MTGAKAVRVLLAATLALGLFGCRAEVLAPTDLSSDPVAAVLMMDGPKSQLVVVDLKRFAVARRIRLRSLSTSIDGDPVTRTVVTAQSGQPHDHDNACGVVDIKTGAVRYVDTKLLNPDNVILAGGKAYLIHGLQEGDHLLTSVVDVSRKRLLANGRASDRAGQLAAISGSPVVPVSKRNATQAWTAAPGGLQRLDDSGRARWIARLPYRSVTVLGEQAGTAIVVGSIETTGAVEWAISRVDLVSGQTLEQAPISHVEKGVIRGAVGNGEIYLCDENGLDPAHPGNSIIVLDAASFREKRRFAVPGSPADVDLWGHKVVVSDGKTGELLLYEPGGSRPTKRVRITDNPLMAADTVIFSSDQMAVRR